MVLAYTLIFASTHSHKVVPESKICSIMSFQLLSGRRLLACQNCGRQTTPSVCMLTVSISLFQEPGQCARQTLLCSRWSSCVEQFASEH